MVLLNMQMYAALTLVETDPWALEMVRIKEMMKLKANHQEKR